MRHIAVIFLTACILVETVEQALYRMGGRHRTRYLTFVVPAVLVHVAGLGLWLLVLRWMTLGAALPLLAITNITVALMGRLAFGEYINRRRWIGILLIVAGVSLVAIHES